MAKLFLETCDHFFFFGWGFPEEGKVIVFVVFNYCFVSSSLCPIEPDYLCQSGFFFSLLVLVIKIAVVEDRICEIRIKKYIRKTMTLHMLADIVITVDYYI